MLKKQYDIVYLSNTPSFYKINLCKEIAKRHSLLLVLQGKTSQAVNGKEENLNFDTLYLYDGDMDERSRFRTFWRLVKLMGKIECKKILYSGWMAMEYNVFTFFSPKSKNVMVCESSCYESKFQGVLGYIKRLIIGRMSAVLPSGAPHAKLFEEIGFDGDVFITGGVGLLNKGIRDKKLHLKKNDYSYLCVARLIPVKNLEFLINAFNKNGKSLTIVGRGPLENELKRRAKDNVKFIGYVDNEKIGEIYTQHDIFILPSKSEVWGLVVDEALYWGLPVIVSDKVGANIDLVKIPKTGVIFDHTSEESLAEALSEVESNYGRYKDAVNKYDFEERDYKQVDAYSMIFK
ncbi:MAG: glycosyltransferase family 4 protein [Ruminococcus flavefaciens]|nr:glycosyltransferase family 4 protein [Bacteroides sp.]MCM1233517.1 glycosyltransferase family 4 protein [Ruminococcus flavefaciens]